MRLALVGWLLVLGGVLGLAQTPSPEQGDYPLRNFLAREYGAFFQNWSVIQGPRGLIYVGNSYGVLEYDGVRWRLIRTERGMMVCSLAASASGRIYVGGIGEFGYLAPDAVGEMRFVSMADRVAAVDRPVSEIWSIAFQGEAVFFQAYGRLIRIEKEKTRVWNPTGLFWMVTSVGNRIYVQESGRGLLELRGDTLETLPGGDRFADDRVRVVLPWDGGDELIATQTQGIFLRNDRGTAPWTSEVDSVLREAQINHVLPLADGTLAIATQQAGLIHLSRDGRLLSRVGKEEGLPIDAVKWLAQDSQQGLWMALGRGISRVEIPAPITRFDYRRGLPGTVISIFRHRGILYAGTDQGLFFLADNSAGRARFFRVKGINGSTWSYVPWGEVLLAANNDGLYSVRGDQSVRIWKGNSGLYHLHRSEQQPNRLFLGLQNGLTSLLWTGNRWQEEKPVVGLLVQVRSMVELANGELWVGTGAQGVVRIRFQNGRHGLPRIDRFGSEQGLHPGPFTYVHRLSVGFRVSTQAGFYRFRLDQGRFEPDPLFAGLFPEGPRWVYAPTEDRAGRIWLHSSDKGRGINEPGALVPNPDGTYRWEGRARARIAGDWVESILAEADGVVWFGTSEGLARLDPGVAKTPDPSFRASVRRLSVGDQRLIFAGTPLPGFVEPRIPFRENRMRFEFAAASFDQESPNQFQFLLEGADREWSFWTVEAFRDYSNLDDGPYRFRVRARSGYGLISAEDSFSFRVLPPWYRTWWAWVLWTLGGLLAIYGIIHLYTLKLQRQKRNLEQLVAQRTQQLHEASLTDPLTGLRNRRFIQEVLRSDIHAFIGFKNHLLGSRNQRLSLADPAVFGLFLIDIDFFKTVNDSYGHDAGDQVLKQFAQVVQKSVRQDDVVMRVGGEEFLVVLKKTAPEYLPVFANKVRQRIAATPFDIGNGQILNKTCSIGYTRFPLYEQQPDRLTFEQTIMVADLALYHAKEHGRNCCTQMVAGSEMPSGEEVVQKTVTSLEFAQKHGFLRLAGTLKPEDRNVTG